MATHTGIPVWRIPWTEEPGRLPSTGSRESDTTEQLSTCACKEPWPPLSETLTTYNTDLLHMWLIEYLLLLANSSIECVSLKEFTAISYLINQSTNTTFNLAYNIAFGFLRNVLTRIHGVMTLCILAPFMQNAHALSSINPTSKVLSMGIWGSYTKWYISSMTATLYSKNLQAT